MISAVSTTALRGQRLPAGGDPFPQGFIFEETKMSKATKTTETALRVNQEKLVNNLRFSFTNATSVLAEMLQNARRAGATKVERLCA